MNKCFQKVPSKEPPRDIYTRLGAFYFLASDRFHLNNFNWLQPLKGVSPWLQRTLNVSSVLPSGQMREVADYGHLMSEDEAATV